MIMSGQKKARETFCKWAEEIGFTVESIDIEEDKTPAEENTPAPLGSVGQYSTSDIRDQFADYMENTVHFH